MLNWGANGHRQTDARTTDLAIYYSDDYTLAGYAFDTTRKSALVAASLRAEPIAGVRIVEPEPLTQAQLAQVHDPAYVRAVRVGKPRALAESQDFNWDPGLWRMVCASNGGAVAAALAALESGGVAGSLSSGLHHAKRDHGDGFCTFNGLALAARAAQRAGARRILIIDLDAHCGGGTAQLLGSDDGVRQLDVAVSPYDYYQAPPGWTLDVVDEPDRYMPTIKQRLTDVLGAGQRFDLVLYNAGMDPFEECEVGGLEGIDAKILRRRDRYVFDFCRWELKTPVAFVLAGGYASDQDGQRKLTDLHRSTVEAAAAVLAAREPLPFRTCPHCDQPVERVRVVHGLPTWQLGQAAERGQVVLGGCVVDEDDPQWACPNCREPL